LLNDWHVVAVSGDIVAGQLLPLTLLERDPGGLARQRGTSATSGRICASTRRAFCPRASFTMTRSSALSRLELRQLGPMRVDAGGSQGDAAEKGPRNRAQDAGEIRPGLGLARRAGHTTSRCFLNGRTSASRKCCAVPTNSNRVTARSRISSTPRIFRSCMPASMAFSMNPTRSLPYEVQEGPHGLSTIGNSRHTAVRRSAQHSRSSPYYRVPAACDRWSPYFTKRVQIADPARAAEGNPNDRFCTYLTAQQVNPSESIVRIVCAMNFSPVPTDEQVRSAPGLGLRPRCRHQSIRSGRNAFRSNCATSCHHRTDLLSKNIAPGCAIWASPMEQSEAEPLQEEFTVVLARSGAEIPVRRGETILEALLKAAHRCAVFLRAGRVRRVRAQIPGGQAGTPRHGAQSRGT